VSLTTKDTERTGQWNGVDAVNISTPSTVSDDANFEITEQGVDHEPRQFPTAPWLFVWRQNAHDKAPKCDGVAAHKEGDDLCPPWRCLVATFVPAEWSEEGSHHQEHEQIRQLLMMENEVG